MFAARYKIVHPLKEIQNIVDGKVLYCAALNIFAKCKIVPIIILCSDAFYYVKLHAITRKIESCNCIEGVISNICIAAHKDFTLRFKQNGVGYELKFWMQNRELRTRIERCSDKLFPKILQSCNFPPNQYNIDKHGIVCHHNRIVGSVSTRFTFRMLGNNSGRSVYAYNETLNLIIYINFYRKPNVQFIFHNSMPVSVSFCNELLYYHEGEYKIYIPESTYLLAKGIYAANIDRE